MDAQKLEVFGVERQMMHSPDFAFLREAESLRHKLQKERGDRSVTFFIFEVRTPSEPFVENGIHIGWIPKPSKYRLYEIVGDLGLCVEVALCLGFRPKTYSADAVTLRNEVCELLEGLESRGKLRLDAVTDSSIMLRISEGALTIHDVEAVLEFDKKKFGISFREVGRGGYKDIFLQEGFLLIGSEF